MARPESVPRRLKYGRTDRQTNQTDGQQPRALVDGQARHACVVRCACLCVVRLLSITTDGPYGDVSVEWRVQEDEPEGD